MNSSLPASMTGNPLEPPGHSVSISSMPLPFHHQLNVSTMPEEDHDADDIEGQLKAAAANSELPMSYNLFYVDAHHENAFLRHEMERCFVRSNVAHFILTVLILVSAADDLRQENPNMTLVRSCLALTIIYVTTCVSGWLVVRYAKKHESGPQTPPKHDTQEVTSTPSILPAELLGSRFENVQDVQHATTSNTLVRWAPRLHELRCFVCALSLSVAFTFIYATKQQQCRYARVGRNDNVPEDNHDCPFHLWAVMPWIAIIWIIVGQPRFMFFAAAATGVTLLTIIIVQFHGLNPLETVLMFFFIGIMTAFLVALKYLEERRSRRQFEAMFALEEQRAEVHERTAQLHDFVKRITPEHLQKSRLSNISAGIVSVDIATEATCVVLFVANAVSFMHTKRPLQGASLLATVSAHAQHICKNFALHHIHSMGDHMYFVSNLFNEDTPTSSAATLNAIRFTAAFWDFPHPWDELDLHSGVSYGELTGLPIGTTVIHYDVLGPALTEAEALSKVCKPRRVAISEAVYNTHRPYLTIDASTPLVDNGGHVLIQSVSPYNPEEIIVSGIEGGTSAADSSCVSAVTESAAPPSQAGGSDILLAARDLSIDTYGCFFKRFKDTAMESAFGVLQSTEAATTVQLVGGFYLIMAAFVLAVTAIYFASRSDDKGGGLLEQSNGLAFLVMWIVAVLCFLAVVVMARLKGTVSTSMRMLLFTGSILMFVGTSLMRPSPMANGMGYQLLAYCIGALYFGASEPAVVVFASIVHILIMALGLLHHSLATRILFFSPAQVLVIYNTYLHFHHQERCLFAGRLKSYIAIGEIKAHERVRKAVLRSIIPRQVEARMPADALNTHKIECWSQEDCVVLSVILSQPHQQTTTASLSMSSSLAKVDVNEESFSTRFHSELTAATNKIQAIVEGCTHRSLEIISIFGGQLLIAGPLNAQEHEQEECLERAIADATEIIEAMLADSTIKFTAAVVFEQIVSAARFTLFPSYDVFGAAVNMAHSLAAAAPTEMAVASEKLANFYAREIVPKREDGCSSALEISPTETWRIRGVGSMSVCRLKHSSELNGSSRGSSSHDPVKLSREVVQVPQVVKL